MKKYALIIVAALTWMSCGQSNDHANQEGHDHEEHSEEVSAPIAGVLDPVCKMTKDDTWTEFTATGTDTVWFCSPHCKETFAKNPEKYNTVQ